MNKLTKLLAILKVPALRRPFLQFGVAGGVEHLPVLRQFIEQDIQTVVDIGANRGQFALAARAQFPAAQIISFEPLEEPAGIFRRVFAGDTLVTLHQVAIGQEEKESSMHVSHSDDSSSLLPISDLQNELFPNTEEKEVRKVTVKRLVGMINAAEIRQPALLKIDVQGFEKEVLLGIGSLIRQFQVVYVECSFMELYAGQALAHEVIALLQQKGFRLQGVYNLSYDNNSIAIQGDFLFTHVNPVQP
jgi:FkbM family methyltransferase